MLLLAFALATAGLFPQEVFSEEDYDRFSRQVMPRDSFPVLNHPEMATAERGNQDLRHDEPVIGIFLDGEAKAYPIAVMGRHELANDTCGKIPIAVSW